MEIRCDHCEFEFNVPDHISWEQHPMLATCTSCQHRALIGRNEDDVRKVLEKREFGSYPKYTAARAMALSRKIYAVAQLEGRDEKTQRAKMSRITKTQKQLLKHQVQGEIIDVSVIAGRTFEGYTDSSVVAAIVVIDNGEQKRPRYSIYVVFRGSIGMKGSANRGGAGFAMDHPWQVNEDGYESAAEKRAAENDITNVDWSANLHNQMVALGYGGDPIAGPLMVHEGFQKILTSYRKRVRRLLEAAEVVYSDSHVVITGHSQGAGHAILFAHYLRVKKNRKDPLLCMPFAPPRVGNFAFADDFRKRVSAPISPLLPWDETGGPYRGAYLMIHGNDVVTVAQTRPYSSMKTPGYAKAANDSRALVGILGKKNWAEKNEEIALGEDIHPSQLYFHPPFIVRFDSKAIHKGLNHLPTVFRNKLLKRL
jgi:hypothetical protein